MKLDEPIDPCEVCGKPAFLNALALADDRSVWFRFLCEGNTAHAHTVRHPKEQSTMICDRCSRDVESLAVGHDTQGTAICATCQASGPPVEELVAQDQAGEAEALDGCLKVPSDGYCEHGLPTWLRWLGLV